MKAFQSFVCASCRRTLNSQPLRTPLATTATSTSTSTSTSTFTSRSISSTAHNNADDAISRALGNAAPSSLNSGSIASLLDRSRSGAGPPPVDFGGSDALRRSNEAPPHRMHVYATKHNTHITFTQPPKKHLTDAAKMVDVLLSMSTGNIGFRKAGRGSYDAGYQLAAFILKQIQERGLLRDINKIEVVLRGFGAGREAVSKALLGQEGRLIRNKIVSVKDATRLKFGGTRSPKPRRLG